ncbi:PDZD8 family protein [Megaselia abdita]
MDLLSIFLFGLISAVVGGIVMLLFQFYIFTKLSDLPQETLDEKFSNDKYFLPDDVKWITKSENGNSNTPLAALNLVLSFLFQEMQHTDRLRKWFYRKLSLELEELLQKTAMGKFFEKLTISDLNLGTHMPEIKNLKVQNIELDSDETRIECLDVLLELNYKGNFRGCIEADMVLGKKGSLQLIVQELSGPARLQFTRNPYNHWSLSFIGDPQLTLGIESQFQGRQLQSNITNVIINQIRKALRRKHTLPNYKMRFKPFFTKIEEEYDIDSSFSGDLRVKVSEISRLLIPPEGITEIFCTLTMASQTWVEAKQKDNRNIQAIIDVEIHRAKNQQIGIVFKQCPEYVEVESILPNTPAVKANIKAGDCLISVEGKLVNSIPNVAKILKSLQKPKFVLRFERIIPGIIRNDAVLEDIDIYEDIETIPFNLNLSKMPPLRRGSGASSSESSVANTPSQSPRKSKIIAKVLTKVSSSKDPETVSTKIVPPPSAQVDLETIEYFYQHSTIFVPTNPLMIMEDLCTFKLGKNSNYLNICIYGKSFGQSFFLGYLSIPIINLMGEYTDSTLKTMVKQYHIVPPIKADLSDHPCSSLNGFDPLKCFGDILMTFKFTDDSIQGKGKKKKKREEKVIPKTHDFVRTQFNRSTQCEFCGKKIWLKDAVQCKDCGMCCHKKCINKCQISTVCSVIKSDESLSTAGSGTSIVTQVTLTEPVNDDDEDEEDPRLAGGGNATTHRSSISGFLAEGLKRVNSANNLAIPGIVPFGQNSRSLPPSPQHSPRRQSLISPTNGDPFTLVTQRLEALPHVKTLSPEQIASIAEPIIHFSRNEDIMDLAKEASKKLYEDLESDTKVIKINLLKAFHQFWKKFLEKLRFKAVGYTQTC